MQARFHYSERGVRPARTGWVFVLVVAVLLSVPAVGSGQDEPNLTGGSVATPNEPVVAREPVGPYAAAITGNDVYIRSGPGTNFYHCGKLYNGDRVQVIKSQQGWSCIIPPPGCFSWISMRYVSINLENPTMGIVTGDNVGVYAGSDYWEPMHSTSKQVTLNRGQMVKLLGEEKDDYYKIAPPQSAWLWVSSQFVQMTDPALGRPPEVNVGAMVKLPTEGPTIDPKDPNAVPKSDLDVYYILGEQVKAERAKPIAEQSYVELKKKLAELAAKKDAGRAARYAEFTLKQVEAFDLACKVAQELAQQNKELQKVTARIDEARVAKLAQVEDLGKFAIIGKLENSSLYDASGLARRYRILDGSGKTVAYVSPTGSAAGTDFSKFFGRKVGLVGKIQPHEASARAFVAFSEIVPLD